MYKQQRPTQPEAEIEEAITIGNQEVVEMNVETQGIPLDAILKDARAIMGGFSFG